MFEELQDDAQLGNQELRLLSKLFTLKIPEQLLPLTVQTQQDVSLDQLLVDLIDHQGSIYYWIYSSLH